MPGYIRNALVMIAALLIANIAHAQNLEDLFLDALKDYAEKKAEEAGLVEREQGSATDAEPETVMLLFAGVEAPEPDVFRSLHDDTRPSTDGSGQSAAERDCYNRVQGKIAWNSQGNKRWTDASIKNLCRGTKVPASPPQCFYNAMFRGATWGQKKQDKMNWTLASQLCAGTDNANTPIQCLKQKVRNMSLPKAVNACDGKPDTFQPVIIGTFKPDLIAEIKPLQENECYSYVQGRIAWDKAGKAKNWNPNNVKQLCKGTTSKYAPGNCFRYAMHSGSAWGKKPQHNMDWKKASQLCAGTSNANKVTGCFKNAISAGKSLDTAINQCKG